MDAIELIKQDHREVDQLFTEFDAGGADRTALVQEIIRELSIHAAIEEQFLYPAMRRSLPDGDRRVKEALDEHQEVKEVLSDLDGMSEDDPEFQEKVRTLIQDVRHHVEEEEGELLPKLQSALSGDELDKMGRRMEMSKGLAPTRPHPRAPSTPPGVHVAGAMAGVMDRARDAVSGRRAKVDRRQAKKPTAKKPTAKKPTAKQPAAKKSTAKRPAAKKSSARKPAPTRPAGKKTQGRGKTTGAAKAAGRKTQGRTSRAVYHVTPDPRGGWRAAKKGSSRALARGESKSEVVGRAREVAKARSGRLVIHKADGRIQDERTYGRDPRRSKG